MAFGVESAPEIVDENKNKSKLKITEEVRIEINAVSYTSFLLSNFELKLKKVVSIP